MKNIIIDDLISKVVNINKNVYIYWVGYKTLLYKIKGMVENNIQLDIKIIKHLLVNQSGQFAFILKYHDYIYAAVDVVSSYPIFYSIDNKEISISNSATRLNSELNLNDVNSESLLEIYASSYITGNSTIYNGLFKLKPGQLISINTKSIKRVDDNRTENYPEYITDHINMGCLVYEIVDEKKGRCLIILKKVIIFY